jgi:hypothetical protein
MGPAKFEFANGPMEEYFRFAHETETMKKLPDELICFARCETTYPRRIGIPHFQIYNRPNRRRVGFNP